MTPVRRPLGLVLLAAVLLLLFRGWLAAVMPITGDEAYFYFWGRYPDIAEWGYYDHPPMVGWWLAFLLQWRDVEWFIRLPVLLLPFGLAAGAAWLAARADEGGQGERAAWAALLVLLAPVSVWNIFITTDTPLIWWSMASVMAYVAGLQASGRGQTVPALLLHALAGAFLALAFLSKYFAALFGIAIAMHVLLVRRDRGRWGAFFLLTLVALAGPAYNLWWNSGQGWANVMFNLFNRHEDAGWSWETPLLYAVTLAYVVTPFALLALARYWRKITAAARRQPAVSAMLWLSLVPFTLFAVLSLVKQIGLHWLLSFVPLLLVALAAALPLPALRQLAQWFGGFALLHVLAISVIAVLPLETWSKTRQYDGIVLTFRSQDVLRHLQPYTDEFTFASDGYSNAVTYGYNARRYFIVFGVGSSHARHDDMLTDFRTLAGKNILILRKTAPDLADYQPYFKSVEVQTFVEHGVTFYLVLGRGFDYPAYRDQVLREVKDRYYRIPKYLPIRSCYFAERYFPGEECR
jgi:hypothetical protein